MRKVYVLLLLMGALGMAGCASEKLPASEPLAPLTEREWKAMPVDKKYSDETIERLKLGNPKLETAEGWELFQKTVVRQERRKDFPNGKVSR